MPWVYLLFSDIDRKTYLGSTDNIERRLKEHLLGKVASTKYRRPLKLIYSENFSTLGEARKREKYLKTKKGRKDLKEILKKLPSNFSQMDGV